MASDKGPVATEAPLVPPAAVAVAVASDHFTVDAASRPKSLKRTRETTPTSPSSSVTAATPAREAQHLTALGSPSKAARLALVSRRSPTPTPLTAAAALEEERRRREDAERAENLSGASENPSHKALAALSGGALAMSRPSDAPAAAPAAAEAATKVPTAVAIPNDANHAQDKAETSPRSAASVASLAGVGVTESPTPMEVDGKSDGAQPDLADEDKSQPGSLSYPGSLDAGATMPAPPARGMSFPMPGQTSPTSGGKKHKCPFCDTEFTRHHNLKSHLLTHSQEKPYVCQDCQLRFRRLHDLKRHSKLHTGEKPHICPKCDRKFARGDALARHSKGAGGCAGRRSSMGSFAEGEDMEGVSMTEGEDSTMAFNDDDLTEEERRRLSLPSIKAQHVPGQPGAEGFSPHSRTYPPAGARQGTGGLYPPNVDRGTSSANTSPSMASGHTPTTSISSMPHSATTSSSMYSQSGMTESPKPLSPGVQGHDSSGITRQRSPSLQQHFQQRDYSRRQGDRNTSPGLALASPHAAPGTKLPYSGFAAPDARYPAGSGTAHSRTSSGAQGNGGSGSENNLGQDPAFWAYIQSLEDKIKQLSDKVTAMEKADTAKQAQIGYLTTEVNALKQQLEAREKEAPAA